MNKRIKILVFVLCALLLLEGCQTENETEKKPSEMNEATEKVHLRKTYNGISMKSASALADASRHKPGRKTTASLMASATACKAPSL